MQNPFDNCCLYRGAVENCKAMCHDNGTIMAGCIVEFVDCPQVGNQILHICLYHEQRGKFLSVSRLFSIEVQREIIGFNI